MDNNSFNVVGLSIAVLIVVVFAAIVIAVSNAGRRTTQPYTEGKQLRGIHQGLVTFANSNKGWFVGINADGSTDELSVERRFQILIEHDMFTPEYVISPLELELIEPWEDLETPLTKANYSYAMLQIPDEEAGRRSEWAQTLNSQAIVVSDRNTGTNNKPSSIHTDKPGGWAGHVLWNDNHVGFHTDGDTFETKYGRGELNDADHLFDADGLYDALLIHAGNKAP